MPNSAVPIPAVRNPSHEPPPGAAANPFVTLVASLDQLAEVIRAASDDQYVRSPVGVIPGSLGGHVRHCLDHVAALCAGVPTCRIDYDRRERGTPVETSRASALHAVEALRDRIAAMDASTLTREVRVTTMLAEDGTHLESASSLGREVVFVLSHTVHHGALMLAICRKLDVAVPERFGFAPSTLAHFDESQRVGTPVPRQPPVDERLARPFRP